MIRRGFTLVELLVALAIGGILSVLVYGLFDTTSDSLFEVENLSDANERMRFAMDQVRNDIQMAGAHASPDSEFDLWALPGALTNYRVMGITTFNGAQNRRDQLPTAPQDIEAANPDVSFDDFVVMGAYDYPISFEVAGLRAGADGLIRNNLRGLKRLYTVNPFGENLTAPDVTNPATVFGSMMDRRLLRVTDRQGKVQFAAITGVSNAGAIGMNVTTDTDFIYKAGGQEFGLDISFDGDVAYESAFIDIFRYHVEADPLDPSNMRLMRTRLCGETALTAFASPAAVNLAAVEGLEDDCGDGTVQEVVIADRVADFQVWFDCADPNTGAIEGSEFFSNWVDAVNEESPGVGGACMDLSGTYRPGRARRAHIRLSMYAPQERKDLRHYRFEDADGNIGNAARDNGARLATFDPFPDIDGASPVVTLQTSVEMTNHAYRNSRL